MANRSYIYLKNGKDVLILTEGVYTIPYFWQLFWDEKDVRMPNILWKKFNILLPIEKFQKKATQNRSFLEKNAPQTLQLYDDFVRYILANVKAGDMLGFDVLEVADMDGLTTVSRKLIKNIRAIQENQPQELDFSLTEKNIIWSAMGFPDYYASKLLPEDNILDSVAYQDELKKMQGPKEKQAQGREENQKQDQEEKQAQGQEENQEQHQEDEQAPRKEAEQVQGQENKLAPRKEDEQVLDETGAESKDDEYHIPLRFWFLLVLVIVWVYRLFLANK
ncbi:dimethyladenosine transferase [Streptococcus oralis]|uniref:Dimethyladenosine transferase n=1 Tax=Streptococcus oralis subsp. oralis TaxID=1891914 RepID=A0A1X1GTT6_STROR|nr:dimethyladenosine transferase [Streptococcus oralis]ORO50134.1 dimethyladenosine transferase [Streptococcus oralis subsp. oralis]ORO69036.1 dimethyladenosine transferase [Streptococcus oralis subsp. oralis]ORO73875.1 dimethyladenosine transferase [Streptococcus oralis subsp. oralis]